MTNTPTEARLADIAAEYGAMADGLPPQLEDGPGAASAFYMSCSLGEVASMARELLSRRSLDDGVEPVAWRKPKHPYAQEPLFIDAGARTEEWMVGIFTDPLFSLAQLEAVERELKLMETAGIIEVAVRNPSVADYMDHWEYRATTAETQLAALTKRVGELEGALERKQDMLETLVSFVHRWTWEKEGNGTTDAERLDVIKHYPPIAARRLTGGEG